MLKINFETITGCATNHQFADGEVIFNPSSLTKIVSATPAEPASTIYIEHSRGNVLYHLTNGILKFFGLRELVTLRSTASTRIKKWCSVMCVGN